jgi:hypothetical protein
MFAMAVSPIVAWFSPKLPEKGRKIAAMLALGGPRGHPAATSLRPGVTPKKKRKAETAEFMEVVEAPLDLMRDR